MTLMTTTSTTKMTEDRKYQNHAPVHPTGAYWAENDRPRSCHGKRGIKKLRLGVSRFLRFETIIHMELTPPTPASRSRVRGGD